MKKSAPVSIMEQKAAVVRIVAGKSTEADEGRRYKRDKSTISDWVRKLGTQEDVKKAIEQLKPPNAPNPTQRVPTSPGVEPKAEKPAEKTPLEAARAAAHVAAPAGQPLTGDAAIAAASDADKKDAVEICENLKATVVGFMADRYAIPADDKELEKIKHLSALLRSSIEANASWLAPMLREKVGGGRWLFYAYLFLEGRALLRDTAALAVKHHPELGQQPGAPKPQPPAPPPAAAPAPKPPSSSASLALSKELPAPSDVIPGAGGLRIVRFSKPA